MNTQTIDAGLFAKMLLGGAQMLAAHKDELNALNVFPVADGDTGTNMLCTIEGGLSQATSEDGEDLGTFSKRFSRGVLLSARGNSGVILSQIFAGINEILSTHTCADVATIADAYRHGIARSYAAVQNPTEGTILTVFRESTEYAAKEMTAAASLEDFFRLHIEEAKRSLQNTKHLLPTLAEADVVDSGAAGYLYIAEGMYAVLDGKEIDETLTTPVASAPAVDIDRFTRDSVMEYGYCTEFLLRLTTAKVDPDSVEISKVVSILTEMGGESIVAYKQDDIVKVHVHTYSPGEILAKMQAFGEFLTVKIENMNLGHTEERKETPKKELAVVAVAQGDGITALFSQMGADEIVAGGQSANPAIEDFLSAFEKCNAENILVLPNNKNVILAAKQAAELCEGANVHVIPTKSIASGYSALSVITPGIKDVDALVASATRAAEDVIDGEITRAVRDTVIGEKQIREGDYLAISGGEIVAVEQTPEDALLSMLENAEIDLCEIITLFVGSGVSEARRATLTEQLNERYDEFEIIVYEGGQNVYDYLVAIE